MCFWWFMLLCDLIIPIVMVIAGRMMWKHCPKHINSMLGYRTTRSMKNMDMYINGKVGERFGVRNSGAIAVIEGAGDHCEISTHSLPRGNFRRLRFVLFT